MIPKREILEIATSSNLTAHVIEKDYVLGWIMAGINQHKEIGNSWVFKGGTCLKKCYFETYRFSEDLDFTLRDKNHINADYLKKIFDEIAEWIYEQSGIELPVDRMIFDIYQNPRGVSSCQGRLFYKGPFAPQSPRALPRIKLDISTDEIIVMPPVKNSISHHYSDHPQNGFQIECYPYEEIFAEKIRALAERSRPRDLYDVINFYRRPESQEKAIKVMEVLKKKCDYKGIEVPDYNSLKKYQDECLAGWEQQLSHQLQVLPPFDSFWQELQGFFQWLTSPQVAPAKELGTIPVKSDAVYNASQADISAFPATTLDLGSLDRVRFAAANHLCVELVYRREDGTQKTYLIEPYSLRRTPEGNLLLYSVKHNTSEIRAFRTDRIISATATNINFIPKYRIEFLPAGLISTNIPMTNGGVQSLGLSRKRNSTQYSKLSRHRSSGFGSGNKYIYQCSLCRKNFTRSKMDGRLNPHKNKSGWNCPGRVGIYMRTKY
jgi:predicted nucleotidyltransferase component of viral defense system